MRQAQSSPYVAGMPQLAYAGLSENWLLKECGQRHWSGIAHAHGLAVPRFEDASGRTAYAAFTAIRLSTMLLDRVREHDTFTIASALHEASRSQHYSCHMIDANRQCMGRVEMLSAFVQRLEAGNNQSVTRAAVGAAPWTTDPDAPTRQAMNDLLSTGKAFRAGTVQECAGLRPGVTALREFGFAPCPNNDFNGANFMYFASFQALADRAEWAWFRRRDLPQMAERQLYFHGNVNVGDEVSVQLMDCHEGGSALAHWCRVVRQSDGACIADIITRKCGATTP